MKCLKNTGFELKRQITLPTETNEGSPDELKPDNMSPIQIWRNQISLRT